MDLARGRKELNNHIFSILSNYLPDALRSRSQYVPPPKFHDTESLV